MSGAESQAKKRGGFTRPLFIPYVLSLSRRPDVPILVYPWLSILPSGAIRCAWVNHTVTFCF